MLIIVERKNLEQVLQLLRDMGKARVHLPRPLRAEELRKIDPYIEEYQMPESTWRRLSKEAKKIVGERTRIRSMRGRFGDFDVELVAQILALRRAGLTVREIARDLGIPKSTVHYVLTRERKIRDGNVKILIQ